MCVIDKMRSMSNRNGISSASLRFNAQKGMSLDIAFGHALGMW